MPTPEQLKSRQELKDFIERVARPVRELGAHVKSKWFSRPDEELKGWIERGRALAEIEDSMGYQLIVNQVEKEIEYTRNALEVGTANDIETRGILKGLRFLHSFILTTKRDADISSSVLAGRESQIGRDSAAFVKNARVEN